MAVLPDGLGDHQRRIRMDVLEDIHAHALVEDEAVLEVFAVKGCARRTREALGGEGLR